MRGKRLKTANQKARKTWAKYHPGKAPVINPKGRSRVCLGTYRKTKVFCSARCCGNLRAVYGETMQERIATDVGDEW